MGNVPMITLQQVKDELRIDFNDQDDLLQRLLSGEVVRAETMTGLSEEDFNEDIENGVLKGVKTMYLNREGLTREDLATSTMIYRKYSTKPMF